MSVLGIVDIGSNAIRFSIIKELRPCLPTIYNERINIALLPEIEKDGAISTSTLNKVISNLKRCKKMLENIDKDYVIKSVATESIRSLKDGESFLNLIKQELGWQLDVLSKKEESQITSLGVISCFYNVEGLIFDLGGGSLEINYLNTSNKIEVDVHPQSLKLGSQRISALSINLQTEEYFETELYQSLDKLNIGSINFDTIYFSGGGLRSIGYLYIHEHKINNFVLNGMLIKREEMINVVKKYLSMNNDEIEELDIFHISKMRKKHLKANCLLALKILEVLSKADNILFSVGGVKHGLAYKLLNNNTAHPFLDSIDYFLIDKPKLETETVDYLFNLVYKLFSFYKLEDIILKSMIQLSQFCNHLSKDHIAHYLLNLFLKSGELSWCPAILLNQRCVLAILLVYIYGGEIEMDEIKQQLPCHFSKKRIKELRLLGRIFELILMLKPLAYLNQQFEALELSLDVVFQKKEIKEITLKYKDIELVSDSERFQKKVDKLCKEEIDINIIKQ